MYCTFCGSSKHTLASCPKTWPGSARRATMRCRFCGSRGHNTNACPKTRVGNVMRARRPYAVEDDYVED